MISVTFFSVVLFLFLFLLKKICLFTYAFLAALGLLCCVWAFCSCGERGLLFVVASLVAEHRL